MSAVGGEQFNPDLTITRRFQAPTAIPGVTGYGRWDTFTWDNRGAIQHGVRLTPSQAPWRELFAVLDVAGTTLPPDPVTLPEEADAIVACCWRYGSYAHLLTSGELYRPFRVDRERSRIGDAEMKRINLEFSSGLASWFAERAADPAKIHRRVRAALALLPIPWRGRRGNADVEPDCEPFGRELRGLVRQFPAASGWPVPTLREEANRVVVWAYRNGPIEDLHAGMYSHGTEIPGFKRLYADEIKRLGSRVARKLEFHLAAREQLGEDYLRFALTPMAMGSAHGWSVTGETAPVEYLGLPGAGPLDARLRWLAAREPLAYGRAEQDWTTSR
jgi:hypothetical protein